MNDNQKIIKAYWWILNNAEIKFHGHLDLTSDSEIILEMDGVFYHELGTHFTIIGVTDNNRYFTLNNCYLINTSFTPGEKVATTSTYKVRKVFEGKLTYSDTEPTFKNISIQFEHGNLFGNKSQYDIKYSKEAPITLTTTPEKTTQILIDDECTLKIFPWSNYPIVHPKKFKEFTIKQDCIFKFEFKSLLPIDLIVNKYIRHFDHFLMLALRRVNRITEVSYQDSDNQTYRLRGQLYETGQVTEYRDWEIYFDADFCDVDLEKHLQNWFHKANKLEHAINSYFSQLRDSGYVEDYFLSLARSLEVFDRFVNETVGNQEYAERIRSHIKNSEYEVDDEKFILKNLNFIHEPTFKQRLQVLLDNTDSILNEFINHEKFIKNVGDLRNYYTHYSADSKRVHKVLELNPLHLATQMKLLLDFCFLEAIGFSLDTIKEMLNKRSDKDFLKSLR